ncbi:MAG: hypothetical protein ACMXYG_00150 [Candidatus Woesearchaeota archaeon]
MPLLNENVTKIIDDLGIKTTYYWLNMLKSLPMYQLGVVKSSGKLLDGVNLGELCAEMVYLAEHELYLPLVLGGGVQYDSILKNSKKVNGIRITSEKDIDQIVKASLENQINVANQLSYFGVESFLVPPDFVFVQPHGPENLNGEDIDVGYVGDIIHINTKPIIQAIQNNRIPIFSHVGKFNDDFYNVNATTVAKDLVKFLQAKKLILLGDTPIYDSNGNIVKTVFSEIEFDKMVKNGIIKGGMITNGQEAYDLLNYLGPGHSVQITTLKYSTEGIASTGLLEELIGDGSGTKLISPFVITSFPIEAVDNVVLQKLVSEVFLEHGYYLVDNYFDIIKDKDITVYLDSLPQGGAITYPVDDFEYVCKLFTHKNYEGLGIATSILESIILQNNKVVWRSSNESSIEKYKKMITHFDGKVINNGMYTIFMVGIDNVDSVYNSIISLPPTIIPIKD